MHIYGELSFVVVNDDSVVSMWAPKAAPTYEDECVLGRSYAKETAALMMERMNPLILSHIIGSKEWNDHPAYGFKTAFMHRIGELICGLI